QLTALYEASIGLLSRVASDRPLVMVIEDIHWADQSSRELLRFLVRAASDSRLLLVASVRSDHLGDSWGPDLAELRRDNHVELLELAPLGADSVELLAEAITGTRPPKDQVESLRRRSDGNPFFIEELLAAGTSLELPVTVRQFALSRVANLSGVAQGLVRCVAVAGRSLDHDAVAAVTQLTEPQLTDSLREAVAGHVLVPSRAVGGYEFRNAIIGEAVYADMLPGELRPIHARLAAHLASRPETDAAMTAAQAYHWDRGDHPREALPAYIQAGLAAEAIGAYPEGIAHLQRALELRIALPGSDIPACTESAIRQDLARVASRGGHPSLSATVLGPLLEGFPGLRGIERALILEQRARYRQESHDEGCVEDSREAVALSSGMEASSQKARILISHAISLWSVHDRTASDVAAQAPRVAADALAVASASRSPIEEGRALRILGLSLTETDRWELGLRHLQSAFAVSVEAGDIQNAMRTCGNSVTANEGRWVVAVRAAEEALQFAESITPRPARYSTLSADATQAFLETGQWNRAEATIEACRSSSFGSAWYASEWHVPAVRLAAARGEIDKAQDHLRQLDRAVSRDGRAAWLATEVHLAAGRWGEARAAAEESLSVAMWHNYQRAYRLALLLRAEAELRRAAGSRSRSVLSPPEELRQKLSEIESPALGWVAQDKTALCHAEMLRIEGRSDPQLWRDTVAKAKDNWSKLTEFYARIRLAEALMERTSEPRAEASARSRKRHQDKEEATVLLREVARETAELSAIPLLNTAREVASRAKIEIEPTSSAVDARAQVIPRDLAARGITEREFEVLRLVAVGRTNRQIGEELFITERTAALHVAHI
ncbi:MAG: LuxR C-terminal-related transcriptional regulator, partial [Candidatus Limnocylindrales bacterium]